MDRASKRIITISLVILAILAIGAYGYRQSSEFRAGPIVTIHEPASGSLFTEPLVTVSGNAQNISTISLNGGIIFVDSKGDFREQLLLLPGYNLLTVEAQDRFGKKIQKTLELVYKIQNTNQYENTNESASSTSSLTL
ncbi:MAG: hypothetical protein V4467_03555 [Patescibacteria group bacterium]